MQNAPVFLSVDEMGGAIAASNRQPFPQQKAEKIVNEAFSKSLPILMKAAKAAYKRGDLQQATALVAEVRNIRRGGMAKVTNSVRKQQRILVQKLGPSLTNYEAQQAKQAQAE